MVPSAHSERIPFDLVAMLKPQPLLLLIHVNEDVILCLYDQKVKSVTCTSLIYVFISVGTLCGVSRGQLTFGL